MSSAPPRRASLFWPMLLSAIGVTILCALGGWQFARMGEKRAFIDRLAAQALAEPAPMPPAASWPGLDLSALELTRVSTEGVFVDAPLAGVRTTIASGGPGSRQLSGFGRWIFQGFRLADGGVVLVNRGFVPESRFAGIQPARGPARVTGFLRAPEGRGPFTPADLPAQHEFYTRDPAAIASSLGLPPAPFYLEAEREGDGLSPPAGVDVRELIARIPDNHLSYALTWFGLALTLIGVFTAYAWQARTSSRSR